MTVLALRSKAFGTQQILGAIDLTVHRGDRLAILGPSGVGKSTLLRIIAGLDTAFEGDIKRSERLAIVFQEPTLLPWRSLADNLQLTTDSSAQDIAMSLDAVGLLQHAEKFPGQLSLGQQRRVSLARALAAQPELLLLDEPFASLDPELAAEMRSLVNRLISERDMSVVLVTHAAEDADAIGATPLKLSGSPATLQPAQ